MRAKRQGEQRKRHGQEDATTFTAGQAGSAGASCEDLAASMSANWADSGKRLRFMGLLADRQYQEDEDMMMRDQEAPHIVDDGMYNHL